MSSAPKPKMTVEEYLSIERASIRDKHIFYRGEMYMVGGASRHHVKIAGNLHYQIRRQLDDSDCEVMMSDMRVKNERTGSYFYPDVLATCESPKFEDDMFDTLINPQIVIEILSKSTEKFDRAGKFHDYQQLASLKEYVLIAQDKVLVERFTRSGESTWEYWSSSDVEGVLELSPIDCSIRMADIYVRVEFPPEDADGDNLKVVESKLEYQLPS